MSEYKNWEGVSRAAERNKMDKARWRRQSKVAERRRAAGGGLVGFAPHLRPRAWCIPDALRTSLSFSNGSWGGNGGCVRRVASS